MVDHLVVSHRTFALLSADVYHAVGQSSSGKNVPPGWRKALDSAASLVRRVAEAPSAPLSPHAPASSAGYPRIWRGSVRGTAGKTGRDCLSRVRRGVLRCAGPRHLFAHRRGARGSTINQQNMLSDVYLFFMEVPLHLRLAFIFTRLAREHLAATGFGDFAVSFTGHSLGACIAVCCACVRLRPPCLRDRFR